MSIASNIRFFQALTQVDGPAECFAFERGSHGPDWKADFATASDWPKRTEAWLRHRGVLEGVRK